MSRATPSTKSPRSLIYSELLVGFLRRGALVSLALAVVVLLGASSASAALYSVTDIGLLAPAATQTEAYGMNASGQVVGSYYGADTISHAFSYSNGTFTQLETVLPDGVNILEPDAVASAAFAVNDSSGVVGSIFKNATLYHAYEFGTGIIPGSDFDSVATAINASGTIVGYGRPGAPGNTNPFQAFVDSTDITPLEIGADSKAYGINASGVVVGYSKVGGILHAFTYSGGVTTDLTSVANTNTLDFSDDSVATAINSSGQIVGQAATDVDLQPHAFLYDPLTGFMEDIDTDPAHQFTQSEALAINDSGMVVGGFNTATIEGFHAFFYLSGTSTALEDLNDFLDPGSAWVLQGGVLNYATAINSLGQIAGYGTINGMTHAFLLTPVPEPATWGAFGGLFLLGLSARSAWRARKRRES